MIFAARSGPRATTAAMAVSAALAMAPVLLAAPPAAATKDSRPAGSRSNSPHAKPRPTPPKQAPARWTDRDTATQDTDWVKQKAAEKLALAKPSWAGGAFRDQVEELDAPLTAVFAHGRGAYVEMVVPTNVRGEATRQEKADKKYEANNPNRRLAQGFDRYGLENLGGGKIRITQSGTTIAEGRLDDQRVQAWWKPLLTHTRYALKPGTGHTDLSQGIAHAFPDRPTHLTVSRPPLIRLGSYYSLDVEEGGTVLVPRDAALSPVARMLLRDRLLQDQPVDPRVLVDITDLDAVEQVFNARFRPTPIVELARQAGKTTGRQVFGLSSESRGEGQPPALYTVGAVDGQLVIYDEAGNFHAPTEALLAGRSVNLLRTTGKARLEPRALRTPDELSTTTWTFAPHLDDAARLAGQLGPNQTLDVIRARVLGRGLYPEVLRITRTEDPDRYRVIHEEANERSERSFTRAAFLRFLDHRAERGLDLVHPGVFLRRVDANTPYPGVEGPPRRDIRDWGVHADYLLREEVDPYRAWTPAQPGTAPSAEQSN